MNNKEKLEQRKEFKEYLSIADKRVLDIKKSGIELIADRYGLQWFAESVGKYHQGKSFVDKLCCHSRNYGVKVWKMYLSTEKVIFL